jgi:putative DNA primase/helicase
MDIIHDSFKKFNCIKDITYITGGTLGTYDITCPNCGPGRESPANRRRKVMRIWHFEPGFATYSCARCRVKGYAHDGDWRPLDQSKVADIRAEITKRKAVDDKVRQCRALAIWEAAGDLAGTLGLSYLTRPKATGGRALDVHEGVSGRVLRFHPRCPWRQDCVPAVIALYRDIRTDEPKAILRIGLTPDGRKIDRMALGPKAGCAVKLTADEDVEAGLHIGEGVETMMASIMQGFAPAWALGDTGGVETFPVLCGIDVMTICVDHDANAAGQMASSICYDRWIEAGREVWSVIPNEVDADMNDLVAGAA